MDGVSVVLTMLTALVFFTGVLTMWTLQTRVKEYFAFMAALVHTGGDIAAAARAGATAASFTISDFGTAGIMAADPETVLCRWREDADLTRAQQEGIP